MRKINEIIRANDNSRQTVKMVIRQTEADATAVRRFVPSSVEVEWVSEKQDGEAISLRIRTPKEEKKKFIQGMGFFAAGKAYRNTQQLTDRKVDDCLHRDIYGREVLCFRERFPCFDSYDYLNENRYFRWFYIRKENGLTLVYTEDTRPEIKVTEDVSQIPSKWWDEIRKCWG